MDSLFKKLSCNDVGYRFISFLICISPLHLYMYIYNICGSWSVKKIDPETTESLHGYCVDLSQPTANLFKLLGITFLVGKKVQTVDFMAPCLSERYIHMIYIYIYSYELMC